MRPMIRLAAVALVCALATFEPASANAELPDHLVAMDHQHPPAPDVGEELAPAPAIDDATVLALGQVFVSEANWARTPDPEAIGEVLRSRHTARGDATMLDTIRAYSPRATGVAPSSLIR